jgi:hypothetical protein
MRHSSGSSIPKRVARSCTVAGVAATSESRPIVTAIRTTTGVTRSVTWSAVGRGVH